MKAITTNKIVKVLCLLGFISLSSCTTYDIVPGAERVRVLDAEPKSCLFIGEVQSIQKGKTVGTLETYMDLGTRIDLRNKAHELGGNVLVFLSGKLSGTLPGTVLKKPLPQSAKYSVVDPIKKDDKKPASAEPPPAPTSEPPDEMTEEEEEKRDMLIFIGTVFRCPSSVLNQ